MHIAVCGELGAGFPEGGWILSKRLDIRSIDSDDIVKSTYAMSQRDSSRGVICRV